MGLRTRLGMRVIPRRVHRRKQLWQGGGAHNSPPVAIKSVGDEVWTLARASVRSQHIYAVTFTLRLVRDREIPQK
jgi:hypothetical protein